MSQLIVLHGCRTVQLTQGKNALIDEGDQSIVGRYTWNLSRTRKHWLYARGFLPDGPRTIRARMHRLILGAKRSDEVDHRNGDGLDNRRSNIRICTNRQNAFNRKKRADAVWSKYRGVGFWNTDRPFVKKWNTRITLANGKRHHKWFETEREAARYYDEVALREHGEFARTNAAIYGDF